MSEWRKSTCERCAFRVGPVCRRFPPSPFAYDKSTYPLVEMDEAFKKSHGEYAPACAEYAELIEPPKTTEGT